MQVMAQVARRSSNWQIAGRRITKARGSTIEDVLSWSSGASIEWKRMHQDCNRVEVDASGLTFEEWDPTQNVDMSRPPVAMIISSSELHAAGFKLKEVHFLGSAMEVSCCVLWCLWKAQTREHLGNASPLPALPANPARWASCQTMQSPRLSRSRACVMGDNTAGTMDRGRGRGGGGGPQRTQHDTSMAQCPDLRVAVVVQYHTALRS
jgi:hypothetical protein